MTWAVEDVHSVCSELLHVLVDEFPSLDWDAADIDGEQGLIYFNNDHAKRVEVRLDHEALAAYSEAGDLEKERMHIRFCRFCRLVNRLGNRQALFTILDLSP